jgi:hypothetical protein
MEMPPIILALPSSASIDTTKRPIVLQNVFTVAFPMSVLLDCPSEEIICQRKRSCYAGLEKNAAS